MKNIEIKRFDNYTVILNGRDFNFMYTIADYIAKEEFKGKYEYFGGLQSNFEYNSEEYIKQERFLAKLAKLILDEPDFNNLIDNPSNQSTTGPEVGPVAR